MVAFYSHTQIGVDGGIDSVRSAAKDREEAIFMTANGPEEIGDGRIGGLDDPGRALSSLR